MSPQRRFLLRALAACALAGSAATRAQTRSRKVVIAVGGKAALYYLPLTLAEQLGYFKEQDLNVEILDFAGGAKALQAMMGGSADVVAGGFDHVIVLRGKGQALQAFTLMVATPSLALAVSRAKAKSYHSARDLKGMKVGVTAPGSSTHIFLNHLLASAGLPLDAVSVIGVGTGPGAVAAMRAGQIDAICNVEPTISLLERAGLVNVVVETMTEQGSRAVFGESLPAGSLYTREAYIQRNPEIVQALATAMLRTLLWLKDASADAILKTIPAEYTLGDRTTYLAALERQRQGYSLDGLIPPAAAAALYQVLRRFEPAVQAVPDLDVTRTYTNQFVQRAMTARQPR
jgi:NitT/TauT family transport system substrate-binding protein